MTTSLDPHRDRLQMIRRIARGEEPVPGPPPRPTPSPTRKRRPWEIVPHGFKRDEGRHRALANPMFTTLRSSS